MKICLYWYSATGNTLYLARAARDRLTHLGHEVTAFNMLTKKHEEPPRPDSFDKIIFAFPVMIFRPPLVAFEFAEKLPVALKPVETHLLITSGGMGANTHGVYSKLLAQKGLVVANAEELVCADSYIPFRKYFKIFQKKNLPDENTMELAENFADRMVSDGGKTCKTPGGGPVRGFFALIGKKAPREAGRSLLGPRRLEQDKCTGCSLCAKLCPTGAITMEGKYPVFLESACVGCCTCFNNCPAVAWRLKRFSAEYHYSFKKERVWQGL